MFVLLGDREDEVEPQPEQMLGAAVILRALADARADSHFQALPSERRHAVEWFRSKDDEHVVMSFRWWTVVAGIPPKLATRLRALALGEESSSQDAELFAAIREKLKRGKSLWED